MGYSVPGNLDLKHILSMLYQGLDVKAGEPLDLSSPLVHFGVYVDDEDNPVALAASDLSFAVYSSCAMTMVPAPVAEEAIKSGVLEDMMKDNLGEVMNILSRLFMLGSTTHLRFTEVLSVAELPEAAAQILTNTAKQTWLEVEVPRYGTGVIGFLISS